METMYIQPFALNYMFTYIRMVCYVLVMLTSLRGIVKRKFNNLLFVGDILMCFALFITSFNIISTQFSQTLIADRVITPGAILWAGIHFYDFIKFDNKD